MTLEGGGREGIPYVRSGTSRRSCQQTNHHLVPSRKAGKRRKPELRGRGTGCGGGGRNGGERGKIGVGKRGGGWGVAIGFAPTLGKPREKEQLPESLTVICVGNPALTRVLRNFLSVRGGVGGGEGG